METSERSLLLEGNLSNRDHNISSSGLSVIFAIICIVDVFGVFPIVSLPKAIFDCGYIGIFVVILVCSAQIYTATLLGKCWIIAEYIEPSIQNKNRYPYSALAEITYGNNLSKFVTFLLDLTVFGGGIPNLIVASQNLQFLGRKVSENSFDMSFCYWIIILGTIMCPFLWLGSPKDMKLLCTVSVILVLLVFTMIVGCILTDTSTNNQMPSLPKIENPLWQNILTAYGILAFQFDIHPTILTIQVDMKYKSQIDKAVIGGFTVSLGLFSIICVAFYSRYGGNVGPSILEMLPSAVTLYFTAAFIALQLSLSSAISNTALYQHIEDYMRIPRDFNQKRCIIRSILAFSSVIMAESVPKFDLVMSLIGGALTGPLVFILPPLFYIKMMSLKAKHEEMLQLESFHNVVYKVGETSENSSKHTKPSPANSEINIAVHNKKMLKNSTKNLKIILCGTIILLGSITTIATTYLNIVNTIQYVTFTPPCIVQIYNISLYNNLEN